MSLYNPQETVQPAGDVEMLRREVGDLRQRVAYLEGYAQHPVPATSGMMSSSFMTRAFSVWGHYFVAQLIIGLGILVLVMLFGACTGILIGNL